MQERLKNALTAIGFCMLALVMTSVFATTVGGMYPVRLCLHILPDAFWHVVAGSWSVSLAMLGCVRFFLNVFKHAGFRSESCGISGLCKVEDFRP